jgi:hypothetical protein
VLRLIGDKDESMLIMDAKYMQSTKAFHEAMPECVMKYLHGIHVGASGQNRSIGLMIVNPDEADVTRHFHHQEYSIHGKHPVTPAIMTASIDVAKAHKLDSTIQHDIFRLIELMVEKVSDNGLGEIKVPVADLYDNFESKVEAEVFTEVEVPPEETKEVEEPKHIRIEAKLNQDKPVELEPEPKVEEKPQAKPIPKPVQLKKVKKPIITLPSKGLINIKQDKGAHKKQTNTKSASLDMELGLRDERLKERELLIEKMDLKGNYVSYELLPNHDECNAVAHSFSMGSLPDLYIGNAGVIFPEFTDKNTVVDREISVSIKGSDLISEDKFASLKTRFIT